MQFFVPLIYIVALCCNCMMNVSSLARFLMDHQQKYVFTYAMFSKREAVLSAHPLRLFLCGKIDCSLTVFLICWANFIFNTCDLAELLMY